MLEVAIARPGRATVSSGSRALRRSERGQETRLCWPLRFGVDRSAAAHERRLATLQLCSRRKQIRVFSKASPAEKTGEPYRGSTPTSFGKPAPKSPMSWSVHRPAPPIVEWAEWYAGYTSTSRQARRCR